MIEGATPAIIDDILDKALARLPEERYHTAAALQRALEDAIQRLGLDGSTEAVADFVRDNLGDRLAKRQDMVNRALESAARRMPPKSGTTNASEMNLVTADLHAFTPPPPSFEEAPTVAAASFVVPDKPVTEVPVAERTAVVQPEPLVLARKKRSPWFPIVLVAAAAGAVVFWRSRTGETPTPPVTRAAPSATESVPAPASATESVSASVTASVSAAESASVSASAPSVLKPTPPPVVTARPTVTESASVPPPPLPSVPPPPDEDDPYQ